MNKIDYMRKALEHLSDGSYELIDKEWESAKLNKPKDETTNMVKSWKLKLDGATWFLLNPKFNLPSRFYCLPKIHKPNVPIRL